MTDEQVIAMARKVFGEQAILPFPKLLHFAKLVAEAEREACALICDAAGSPGLGSKYQGDVFADAIRARKDV